MRPVVLLVALAALLAGCAQSPPAPGGGNGDNGVPSMAGGECVSTKDASVTATNPTWVVETNMGTMRFTFYCDKAPVTTQNFVNLTEAGYFDGTKFHRVIGDFMNQGGDPLTREDANAARWGTGGPGYAIVDEFYCADGTIDNTMDNPQYPRQQPRPGLPLHQACGEKFGVSHDAAGVLSMANSGPNSGGSQFFVTATATPHLDGAHAVFGKVADDASLDVALKINRAPTDANDRPVQPIVLQKATIEWS